MNVNGIVSKFETSMRRLEEISRLLDNDNIDLDDAISLYEEGIELSKVCFSKLKEAELKVITLKKSMDSKVDFENRSDD